MKIRARLRLYRIPLLSVGLVMTGMAAAYSGWQIEADGERKLAQATQKQQSLAVQVEQARHTQEQSQTLNAGLRRLLASGFLIPSERLTWVEWLHQGRDALALPALHYEFTPAVATATQAPLQLTPLSLQLSLNHAMELRHLLQQLGSSGQVLLPTRECTLERAPQRPEPPQPGPNILAHCKLDWVTRAQPDKASASYTGAATMTEAASGARHQPARPPPGLAAVATAAHTQSSPRLFYTSTERADLDRWRHSPAPRTGHHYQGSIARRGGPTLHWFDGQPQAASALPQALQTEAALPGQALLRGGHIRVHPPPSKASSAPLPP